MTPSCFFGFDFSPQSEDFVVHAVQFRKRRLIIEKVKSFRAHAGRSIRASQTRNEASVLT
jgi:hypothetical protein